MSELVNYEDVNKAWGGIVLPPVTAKKSQELFGRLIKRFGKHPDFPTPLKVPKWARRLNRSWASPKPQDTNRLADGGLPGLGRMVHDASHFVFSAHHPKFKTHSAAHAALEKKMVEYVIARGWHLPKAPPPKPSRDQVLVKELANVEAKIKRWQSKAKRANTALKKLARKQKRLQVQLQSTAAAGPALAP